MGPLFEILDRQQSCCLFSYRSRNELIDGHVVAIGKFAEQNLRLINGHYPRGRGGSRQPLKIVE